VKQLQDKGILLGIKVDKGVVPLFGTDGETTIQVRRPPRRGSACGPAAWSRRSSTQEPVHSLQQIPQHSDGEVVWCWATQARS